MIDVVAAGASTGRAFQRAKLPYEPIVARQYHTAAVEQRQEVHIDFALVALARNVSQTALVELLARKLTTKSVTAARGGSESS